MDLKTGEEIDKRCVINWLNDAYASPRNAFLNYSDEEIKMYAHDALVFFYKYYGDLEQQRQDLLNQINVQNMTNFVMQEKCKCCPHMYNYKCRAKECPYEFQGE